MQRFLGCLGLSARCRPGVCWDSEVTSGLSVCTDCSYSSTASRLLWHHLHHLLTHGCTREDDILQPLGFILPPHTERVDRQACGNDAKTNGTLIGCLPKRYDDEEETGQHKGDGQQDVNFDWSL